MNKKIFCGIAILAIAVAVAFNVSVSNQKQDAASLLALANVEALADENTLEEVGPREDGGGSGSYCMLYPEKPGYCWRAEFTYSNLDYRCRKTGNTKDKCWY